MSSIADQFKGLPIGELIANPLIAAAQAQGKLAGITEQFIEEVGLEKDSSSGKLSARTVDFDYDALVEKKSTDTNGVETTTTISEPRSIKVPLLAIVNTPNLSVKNVKIDFDMKVQSTSESTKRIQILKEPTKKAKALGEFSHVHAYIGTALSTISAIAST